MERKNDNKKGITEFKPATNKEINSCEYKIIVSCKTLNKNKITDNKEDKEDIDNKEDKKKIHCEFMINAKIVDYIIIRHDGEEYKLNKVPYYGIKVSFDGINEKPVMIIIKPKDYCSKVNIWDLKQINEDCDNIKWDKIYVINLKRRPERKENMMMQFEELGINNYEFIEAVDGQDEDVKKEFENLNLKEKDNKKYIVTEGHYGCLKSHMNAIKKAKKEKLKNVMILEDDVIFDKNMLGELENIKIPEYDLLYLGGLSKSLKIYFNKWATSSSVMGGYAYIINYKIFNKVLVDLTRNPIYIDTYFMENIQDNNKFKSYILDDIVKTNIETSDTSFKNSLITKPLDYVNNFNNYVENKKMT